MTQEQRWARASLKYAERNGIAIGGIRLAAAERDRSLFAQVLVLLRETEDLLPDEAAKSVFRASSQTIADIDGNPHVMTVTELRALITSYGAAYQALWAQASFQ